MITHREEDYPAGMMRQANRVFYHRDGWDCPLCDYDDNAGLSPDQVDLGGEG